MNKKEKIVMWHEGQIFINNKTYKFRVKSYENPSAFGIENGKISKLEVIMNNVACVRYDRGYIQKPVTRDEIAIFNMLLSVYS